MLVQSNLFLCQFLTSSREMYQNIDVFNRPSNLAPKIKLNEGREEIY